MKEKKKMTLSEFLKTPNVYPLTEGERYIPGIMRAIPPDVEIIKQQNREVTAKS